MAPLVVKFANAFALCLYGGWLLCTYELCESVFYARWRWVGNWVEFELAHFGALEWVGNHRPRDLNNTSSRHYIVDHILPLYAYSFHRFLYDGLIWARFFAIFFCSIRLGGTFAFPINQSITHSLPTNDDEENKQILNQRQSPIPTKIHTYRMANEWTRNK